MKFKYYLRGLGLGILFASIILAVSFHRELKSEQLSDTDIIQRAEELGMAFPDDTEAGADSTQTNGAEDSSTGESGSEGTDSDGAGSESSNSSEAGAADEGATESPYILTVTGQNSWRDVAAALAEAGVVDDADAFWHYVCAEDPNAALRAGDYEIPVGSDYQTILNIILASEPLV